MSSADTGTEIGRKARRRADVATVTEYHEARLAELLECVREGFARYDAGEIDPFELDHLIHQYKRAARELWKFCGDLTGAACHRTARAIERLRAEGESPDWWEIANPPRDA